MQEKLLLFENPKEQKIEYMIEIEEHQLMDLIHYSRRYCDYRMSYAVSNFNQLYDALRDKYPDLFEKQDQFDQTLMDNGKYFSYATDGMIDKVFKPWPNKWKKDV